MTTAFDCPECGAPLSFEPHAGDKTVVCSYCHETVIIPEELRTPLPRVAAHYQPPPKRSKPLNRMMIIFLSLGLIAACIIFITLVNYSNKSTDTGSIDSGSATSIPLSNVVSATATIVARATVDALLPILQLEQSWPASFTENFTDNSHKWDTGDVRDSYINGNRSISNGTYTWNISTVQSSINFSFPDMPDQQDFYASVDMKLVSMPDDPDADAGLLLRHNSTDKTWYYYSVNNRGQYYFGWYDGTDWYSLISETDSAAIHAGQTNRLTVGVQGSQFIFLINGQVVDHFIDNNLQSGNIGLGINLTQTGEKAIVEFSNFTVLSSSPNP
jgi:hypothetical protein